MKRIKLLSVLLVLVVISSCKKEGCTDSDAVNFSTDAKQDNGTCKYEGRAVIWYGESTSLSLQNDNATSLTYYVNGEVVGSTATSVYWTTPPDCGQNGTITIEKDLGGDKNKSYSYKVIDQTGFEYWSGSITFSANTCQATELTW